MQSNDSLIDLTKITNTYVVVVELHNRSPIEQTRISDRISLSFEKVSVRGTIANRGIKGTTNATKKTWK